MGTVVRSEDTGEIIAEITEHGEETIMLRGGRGGLGNNHFKSPCAHRFAQPGEPGIEGWFTLELKILADIGLVISNAGKSTIVCYIGCETKIADYEFTTLTPNLGIVDIVTTCHL